MSASRDASRRRQQHMRDNANRERFTAAEIGERDNWICRLCADPIDRSWSERDPGHPLAPSIDHIRPVTAGGGHTRANAQITHLGCNLEKNDRYELTLEDARETKETTLAVLAERYPDLDLGALAAMSPEAMQQTSNERLRPERFRAALVRQVERYESKREA